VVCSVPVSLGEHDKSDWVDHLIKHGFVTIPNFMGATEVFELSTRLESLIEDNVAQDIPDPYMVHNPMFRDPKFYEVLRESILTQIVSQFLGPTFTLYAFTTSSMPPNGTNWSRRVHVDCPRLVPDYPTNMNAFIALSDMNGVNGGIELLPDSQWLAVPPTVDEFETHSLIPDLDAGSLLVFYSRLWHSGGFNTTSKAMHALTFNFCRSYMRQRFDYPRMVPESDIPKLDTMQLQLLGFNVRVPTSLSEYYLPVHKRLYKPDQG